MQTTAKIETLLSGQLMTHEKNHKMFQFISN